jgi:uncharacterized protein (TIGR02271 family)
METTIIAVYDNYADAEKACNALADAGIPRASTQIKSQSGTLSTSTDTSLSTSTPEHHEGSAIGNFFRSLFGADDERDHRDMYSESVRRGSAVVTVEADSETQADEAIAVLNRFDPVDIDERSNQWRSQGWTGYDESAPMLTSDEIARDRSTYTTPSTAARADLSATDTSLTGTSHHTDMARTGMAESAKIPVIQEELKIGKRMVQRGGVRVVQRVRETPVNETVNLHEETVRVERHPVDQPATAADLAAFKEGTVEMREMAEEAVVSKTARVVEEVVVGKEAHDRSETINDTVRRTDVDVEQLGAGGMAGRGVVDDDRDFRNHWQTSYAAQGGRYEDYDDAYRYGSGLSANDRFRNRHWADMETDVRSDWESSHPGGTWERVKDAVRYGAERVTGKRY